MSHAFFFCKVQHRVYHRVVGYIRFFRLTPCLIIILRTVFTCPSAVPKRVGKDTLNSFLEMLHAPVSPIVLLVSFWYFQGVLITSPQVAGVSAQKIRLPRVTKMDCKKLGKKIIGGWTSGWWFQTLYFQPYLGKWSNFTSTFFKWVVQPPTRHVLLDKFLSSWNYYKITPQEQHEVTLSSYTHSANGQPA